MRLFYLSIICMVIIGAIVAAFLQYKKYFDRKYEEFEDERYRAAAGPQHNKEKEQDDAP